MKIISKGIIALLLAVPALSGTSIMAQETATNELKYPTLEDLIPGGATYRYAESLYGLQWWGDQCIKPGIDSLVAVNPKNGKETLLTTRESINQALEAEKLGKLSHLYNVQLPWEDQTKLLIALPGRYITYDWKAGKATNVLTFDKQAANTDYTVAGGHVAYTLKNNLYVDNKQVTDEPEGIVHRLRTERSPQRVRHLERYLLEPHRQPAGLLPHGRVDGDPISAGRHHRTCG